jgi:hypothetical protein
LSGGLWREITGRRPAVNPQHERRKYLAHGCLWKFAGLAHLGRERFARARVLAEAGFAPRAVAFENGFLVSEFAPDTCLLPSLDRIADYLVFLRREFPTNRPVDYAGLANMMQWNAGVDSPAQDRVIEDGVVVGVDGRMLPHEWVGGIKTDAVDHHNDHFFPGCQDIAWDIAGAEIEFGVAEGALAALYQRRCSDPTLERRLPFYRRAYLAYRIGYSHLCVESLTGTPDSDRFRKLKHQYTTALAAVMQYART